MKRIILPILFLGLMLTGCAASLDSAEQTGPAPAPTIADAEAVAQSFLDAWTKHDYTTMYGLLSPKSLAISPGAFADVYRKAEDTLKLLDNGQRAELHRERTVRQGTTAVVHYNLTFNSGPLGEFTDANRLMRLVLTPRGWRVAWSTMDVFDGLAGDATLRLEMIQAPRGTIYDRNGQVIAQDATPNVAVRLLTRAYPGKTPQDCLNKLADVFRLREATLETNYLDFLKQKLDYGFTIGHLSQPDYDRLKPQLDAVCLLQYVPQTTRFYYGGGLASQLVGFVGPIPKEDLNNYPAYAAGALVGRQGIEQYWDKQLAGTSGAQLVIRTSDNLLIRTIDAAQPTPGQDVTLTLDRDLQRATEQALGSAFSTANWAPFSTGAAAIVLDVKTGEVLALASYPTVDPDAYLPTTSFDLPDVLNAYNRQRSLFNRATQGLYALGSVFKIPSMAAAADTGTFKLNQIYTDTGTFPDPEVPGGVRKNWIYLDPYSKEKSHGPITLIQALTASCDTYFWEIGKELNRIGNADQLRQYANRMGLGIKTGIDAVPEEIGHIPDPQSKFARTGVRWGVGDNLNTVIGQGDVQVTPIQVARMMAGVANGGTLYRPLVVKQVGSAGQTPSYVATPTPPDKMGIAPAVLAGIQQGLCEVPRDPKLGTATFVFSDWDFSRISVCAKTGTAQTGYPQPNGWFAAYAGKTDAEPDIAVVAIVERSREGSETAGPIVRRIIESYYGLPQEPWPTYWTAPYETMPDPNVSDGIGPHAG